jgi:hypothetical protein
MRDRQTHQCHGSDSDLITVWFSIEKDEDGYPESRSWEGMLSQSTDEGFLLVSVPFYLKNVSKGDLVAAKQGEFLQFDHMVDRGRHNTYRLLMSEAADSAVIQAMSELRERGLAVERNETGILLAVDVPPSLAQDEIDTYLLEQQRHGRWQMQDGYLSSIKAT